jgi:TolB-like protein/Tfp pilus assembly protein PilF
MTNAGKVCAECGATVFADAPEGVCSVCLFRTGLASLDDESDEAFEPTVARMFKDFGDYELVGQIGRGGQGVVYRARQKSLNRIVALKVIGLAQWATEAHVTRFRMEAEAAARLDDPHIVPIYEIGERDGACYYSMKLVEGGRLDKIIGSEPMPGRRAAELVAKLARSLHHAHQHGVLHRDVKPGNVLLDPKGEPHLTDFGLARLVESESAITRTLEVIGTPSYMAPEQASCDNVRLTPASDIYGLGAVFYHLLTGHPPFAGGTTYETVRLVLETDPRRPRLWNARVNRDLETICLKCLDKDPRRRYVSALALAEDLERWLRHEPIRARRAGVVTHGAKWLRRNPMTAVAIASVAALAMTVGIMFWSNGPAARAPTTGIAVLPFENLTNDRADASFVDGLQDDIITKLAKISDLKVISRTSVMQYRGARNTRQIGEALQISHILEGSVRRNRDRFYLNAQLIDTRDDTHIWAEQYDGSLNELFAIQSQIAQSVAAQLKRKVRSSETAAIARAPTADLVAFDYYTHAKTLLYSVSITAQEVSKDFLFQAVDLLNKAIARDPKFVSAYCQLAKAHGRIYAFDIDHSPARRELAEDAVRNAERLAPDDGETHLARARFLLDCDLNFEAGRKELGAAERLLPNDSEVRLLAGYIARRQGRWEESLGSLEKAIQLDPRNFSLWQEIGLNYHLLRRYPEMRAAADQAVAIAPDDGLTRAFRAFVELVSSGNTGPLHETIHDVIAKNPASTSSIADLWFDLALCQHDNAGIAQALAVISETGSQPEFVTLPRSFCRGLAARVAGDEPAAWAAFTAARNELERTVREQPQFASPLSVLGMADAALGRKEDAIREGQRAVELCSVSKDAVVGSELMTFLAVIYAWTGEKDLALEQLAATVRIPGILSYGHLRLHPYWDSLRGDPRFEKILALLARSNPSTRIPR